MLDSTICACRNTDEPFCACSKNVAQHSCCLCVSGNDALTLNSFFGVCDCLEGKVQQSVLPKDGCVTRHDRSFTDLAKATGSVRVAMKTTQL